MSIDTLFAIIRGRRSVREFSKQDISEEEIRILIEAARHAPSNSNRQAWKFLAVKNNDLRIRMREAVEGRLRNLKEKMADSEQLAGLSEYGSYLTFFADAPLLIVVLYKNSPEFLESLFRELGVPPIERSFPAEGFSAAMAVQNLLLAAHALGLGACCTTGPLIAADELRKILKIPPAYLIAALVPVGRPAGPVAAQPRKPVDQILEVIS